MPSFLQFIKFSLSQSDVLIYSERGDEANSHSSEYNVATMLNKSKQDPQKGVNQCFARESLQGIR